MARVLVTGAAGRLGSRVLALLAARDDAPDLVAVDLHAIVQPGVETHQVDLVTGDLTASFAGVDAVLHLASVFGPVLDGPQVASAVEVALARQVLAAADKAGVPQVVLMSSATVYGPWANNAVPLSEDAPLRPHPDLALAVQKAEIERLAAEWATDHPGSTVATLRPATVIQDGRSGWLAQALHAASGLPTGDDTPIQYVHIDDVAAAVVSVWAAGIAGPVNVSPDGWLTPTERQALDPVPRIRLPERVAVAVANWRWRLRLAPTAPGILAYARHPWVVANDRLTATGWTATCSNEEAYVVGHQARAIESITPRRRQELALGVAGLAVAGSVTGVVALIRRGRRRRR